MLSVQVCLHAFLCWPQVGNAIGRGNRHLFLTFLWLELGAILLSTVVGVVRIHEAVTANSKQVCAEARVPLSRQLLPSGLKRASKQRAAGTGLLSAPQWRMI